MAEGARLESVYTGNRIEGSNPSPSANFSILISNYNNLIFLVPFYLQIYLQ